MSQRRRSLIEVIMGKQPVSSDDEETTETLAKAGLQRKNSLKIPPIVIPVKPLEVSADTESSGSASSSSSSRKGGGRVSRKKSTSSSPKSPGSSRKSPLSKNPQDKVPLKLRVSATQPNAAWKNSDKIIKTIGDRLVRGPSGQDKHGFIYIYKLDGDTSVLMRKIGRTERLPERRSKEWEPNAVMIKSWRCRRNRHAEKLIHWLCDRVRVYRYVMHVNPKTKIETVLTVNRSTKQYVQDKAYADYVKKKALPVLSSSGVVPGNETVHIEWFMADEKTLMDIIEKVVEDVNDHWLDEEWSETMQHMK